MSDDMRIYGGQGRQSEQDPAQRRREALRRFKRGRKSGELVEGSFLHLEIAVPGTAWVNLEGTALLAELPEELAALARRISAGKGAGATPTGVSEADFPLKNGQRCYFILESLEPEPLLRMLNFSGAPGGAEPELAAARWQSLLRLPLTQLAARYMQQRSRLEHILQQRLWNAEDLRLPFPETLPEALRDFSASAVAEAAPNEQQAKYAAFLKRPGPAPQAASELELYRAALLHSLQPYGLLGFFFVPWLCPAARQLELAFYRQPGAENSGPDRASALREVSYKLQGELEQGGQPTRQELSGFLGGLPGSPRVLRRILAPDQPDLLRFILSLRPEENRPSFSRKA